MTTGYRRLPVNAQTMATTRTPLPSRFVILGAAIQTRSPSPCASVYLNPFWFAGGLPSIGERDPPQNELKIEGFGFGIPSWRGLVSRSRAIWISEGFPLVLESVSSEERSLIGSFLEPSSDPESSSCILRCPIDQEDINL